VTRVRVLGVDIDPVEPQELIPAIAALHQEGTSATVGYVNAHVLNQVAKHVVLRDFLTTANLVYCDGNGVRLGAKILGRELPARMTGADWIWDLAAYAENKWKLYWIGGEPGVAEKAAAILRQKHPNLSIQTDHGFHERHGTPDAESIERINEYAPDILLVGMGTPEQERWIHERRPKLNVPVVWCLGATANGVAGLEKRGPRWLTSRAEWIARLGQNPSHLWKRYLFGNPIFMARILRERMRD
jgi:N-acetylglucosaminyldiphosphoundecaprenol N-acetyl-beta-D-mannosaminyltransferase